MNILGLLLNHEIRTGGHTRYLDLMEGLAARGNAVSVILNTSLDYLPAHFRPIRFPVPYVPGALRPAALAFRAAVRNGLQTIRAQAPAIDVIMAFGESHLPAAALLRRRLRAPLLYVQRHNTVREELISVRENMFRPLVAAGILWDLTKARRYERMIARAADLVVFQSGYDLEDFVSREPASRLRVRVVRADIRLPRFRQEMAGSNASRSLRRILFVGGLGERKGVAHLIRAVEIVAAAGVRDLSIDVVGQGEGRGELESRVRSAGIQGMVKFHGWVADTFPMTAAADLVIVPSLFDSYPGAVLEALHVGTPVIGTWVGGIPDMLRAPELLFPPGDAQAIADRILALYRDPAAYERVAALCRARRAHFDFDWTGEFEKLLREVCRRVHGT